MGTWMDGLEEKLAEVVEAVVLRDLAIDLGPRTDRNARDETGLRVDFTYEQSATALELTTIADDDAAGFKKIPELTSRLSKSVAGWQVVLSAAARIKGLDSSILPVLEAGREIRPGEYGLADLERWTAEGKLEENVDEHDRLQGLGIVDVVRRPDINRVEVVMVGDMPDRDGIGDALVAAVAENEAKLGESRPRKTHLAVGVWRFGANRDPNESSVPPLPPTIDHLWVIHLWSGLGEQSPIWHATRGADQWDLHQPPM